MEIGKWDFFYEEEIFDTNGYNAVGIITDNNGHYLFYHTLTDDDGDVYCHIYNSMLLTEETLETSYKWTSENDELLIDTLNNSCDATNYCGEGSPIRDIQFKEQ